MDLEAALCSEYEQPNNQSLITKLDLTIMQKDRVNTLFKGCQGNLLDLCSDVLDDYAHELLPIIDQFIASLEMSPPQCLSLATFLDQRIIVTERLIAGMESILLSYDNH